MAKLVNVTVLLHIPERMDGLTIDLNDALNLSGHVRIKHEPLNFTVQVFKNGKWRSVSFHTNRKSLVNGLRPVWPRVKTVSLFDLARIIERIFPERPSRG